MPTRSASSGPSAPSVSGYFGRRHLEQALRTYTAHFNAERPHRSLALLPPGGNDTCKQAVADVIERRDLLGGLIHEYRAAA